MLSSLKDILPHAQANGYAVPAFNCVEDVMVRTILETCEARRSPAILMGLVGPDLEANGWYYISSPLRRSLAESVRGKLRLLSAENRV
jgi:fructose/tagatose bisphosphate aldolase